MHQLFYAAVRRYKLRGLEEDSSRRSGLLRGNGRAHDGPRPGVLMTCDAFLLQKLSLGVGCYYSFFEAAKPATRQERRFRPEQLPMCFPREQDFATSTHQPKGALPSARCSYISGCSAAVQCESASAKRISGVQPRSVGP